MSVLDLAFKRMAMLSTLQNQINQQNATFLEITKVYLVYSRVEGVDCPGVGVDWCDEGRHIFLER
jgi:hypothetical protein